VTAARQHPVTVLVATPLEDGLVERIRREGPDVLDLRYDPDLLPPTRYVNDHAGDPDFRRSPTEEARFQDWLGQAEVLLGVPGETPASLRDVVRRNPHLRWVQGTAAGAGQQVHDAQLAASDLERVTFTSSAGIHATQLAEWAILGLLTFTKDVPRVRLDQRSHRWSHYPVRELRGQRLLVVGLGHIGRQVAAYARALGMHVTGVRRTPSEDDLRLVDEVQATSDLADLVPGADAVVLALPRTPDTDHLFTAELIDALPAHAIVVNVGRGTTVDQGALTTALCQHRLGGAALDVCDPEPLPPDDPLWDLENVLLSPHTAALSVHENDRLVDLFLDNLQRYTADRPLLNVVDTRPFREAREA
jgi:phosphoglycerate dehydrogenase-like enzyme